VHTTSHAFGREHIYTVTVLNTKNEPVPDVAVETQIIKGYDQKKAFCTTSLNGNCTLNLGAFAPIKTVVSVILLKKGPIEAKSEVYILSPIESSFFSNRDSNNSIFIYSNDKNNFSCSKDSKCQIANQENKAPQLIIPTLTQVMNKITIQNERLDTQIKVNTKNTRILWTKDNEISDFSFVRAWIDKQTKLVTYQIYSHVDYEGPWRNFGRANYEASTGLKSVTATKIGSDVYKWVSGTELRKYEDVGFNIDEATLRELVRSYKEGSDETLDYKLVSQIEGTDKIFKLPLFEISGILKVIDNILIEMK